MNRGIIVNRSSPKPTELKDTVIGICKNDEKVLQLLESKNLIISLSNAYLKLCEVAKKTREFYGLRDFYSLIKMIYWKIKNEYAKNGNANKLEWLLFYFFTAMILVKLINIFIFINLIGIFWKKQ